MVRNILLNNIGCYLLKYSFHMLFDMFVINIYIPHHIPSQWLSNRFGWCNFRWDCDFILQMRSCAILLTVARVGWSKPGSVADTSRKDGHVINMSSMSIQYIVHADDNKLEIFRMLPFDVLGYSHSDQEVVPKNEIRSPTLDTNQKLWFVRCRDIFVKRI